MMIITFFGIFVPPSYGGSYKITVVCLSGCLCLSACLSVCLSACLSVCLSACLSVCLSVCLPACLHACQPVSSVFTLRNGSLAWHCGRQLEYLKTGRALFARKINFCPAFGKNSLFVFFIF